MYNLCVTTQVLELFYNLYIAIFSARNKCWTKTALCDFMTFFWGHKVAQHALRPFDHIVERKKKLASKIYSAIFLMTSVSLARAELLSEASGDHETSGLLQHPRSSEWHSVCRGSSPACQDSHCSMTRLIISLIFSYPDPDIKNISDLVFGTILWLSVIICAV